MIYRKIRFAIFLFVVKFLFCVFVTPVVYLLWPVVRIKFAVVLTERIGELAGSVGYLASLKELTSRFPITKIIVFGERAANAHLRSYFEDRLILIDNSILVMMAKKCSRLMEIFRIKVFIPSAERNYTWFNKNYGKLKLTSADIKNGYQELEQLVIGRKDWFVGFHARDSSYLNQLNPTYDFSYHDFRDCSVNNYMKAAKHITDLNGYAIRLGAVVSEPLFENLNKKIIDYASENRTDFLDIFICAKSRFVLANSSGLYLVSTLAGVPVATANMIPFTFCPLTRNDLFIPKLLKWTTSKKTLSFDEIYNLGLDKLYNTKEYIEAGVDIVENTPDEILDLCVEMLERLDRKSTPRLGNRLQNEFKRRYLSDYSGYQNAGDISYKFLARHPTLLENWE